MDGHFNILEILLIHYEKQTSPKLLDEIMALMSYMSYVIEQLTDSDLQQKQKAKLTECQKRVRLLKLLKIEPTQNATTMYQQMINQPQTKPISPPTRSILSFLRW